MSISVKLPLTISEIYGAYSQNETLKEVVKQNLKMLLLTNPGEKVMDPLFGIGISRFLFENRDESSYGEIRETIIQNVSKYLPFVEISDIVITGDDDTFATRNAIHVSISYEILPLDDDDLLEIIV